MAFIFIIGFTCINIFPDWLKIMKNKKEITSTQIDRLLKFTGLNKEDINKEISQLKITQFHVDGDIDKEIESVVLLNIFVDNFKKVIEMNTK